MARRRHDDGYVKYIKENISMRRAMEMIGWDQPNSDGKIRSIYNSEATPSLHVYEKNYYCYSAGRGGDVIKFVMDALNISFFNAIQILGKGAPVSGRKPRKEELESRKPSLNLSAEFLRHPHAVGEELDMAEEFVKTKWPYLTIEDLLGWGIKITPTSIRVPHMDFTGIIRAIKIRALPGGAKFSEKGSTYHHRLYRVEEVTAETKTILLLEGESDTWCATKWASDKPHVGCLGLPTGANTWRKSWGEELKKYEKVIILLDDDRAGQEAREKIAEEIGDEIVSHQIPPGGRFAEAVSTADEWLML